MKPKLGFFLIGLFFFSVILFEMKFIKIFLTSLCLIITTVANADVASQALNKVSEKISNLIPGEGITEVSLDYNDGDEDQLNFSILGVRDIEATDNSNFFYSI